MKYEVNKKLSVGYICDYSSIHSKKHSDWWLMYWKSFDGLHKYCQQGCPHLIKLRNTFLHKLYYKMFFWHFFLGRCLSQLIMNVLTFDDTHLFSLLPTEVSVLLGSSDCSIHTVYTIHIYNTNMHKPFSRKCQKKVHPHSGYHHCRHLDLCSTFPLIADCAIHTLRSLNATNYYQSVHHFKHVLW